MTNLELATLAVIGSEEDAQRAEFEVWLRGEAESRGLRKTDAFLKRNPKGGYCQMPADDCWDAWKASVKRYQWQPIETAPKDRSILLYCAMKCGAGYQCAGHYVEGYSEVSGNDTGEYFDVSGEFMPEGWYGDINNFGRFSHIKIQDSATHWMPLPEPPK